ncbi:MAG: NAD(+)/NADH kinase [Candidatus Latescibacterota bacterium]
MLELRKVGILLRDPQAGCLPEWLQQVFAGRGVQLVCLEDAGGGPPDLDLVVALGGDGTVLRALDLFYHCPVLAINYGTVGFLTAGDRKDLAQIVARVVEGRYIVSERLVLACTYPGGTANAVNEVLVRTSHHMVHVDVYMDDTRIRTIVGDGVVVGTPTGSTAFLLSTGAPIVMPDVRCLILDGINEFNFTSRALILAPDSTVRLRLSAETRQRCVSLFADGRLLCGLEPGQEVCISRAPYTAKLIYLEPDYFFRNLSSKLSW